MFMTKNHIMYMGDKMRHSVLSRHTLFEVISNFQKAFGFNIFIDYDDMQWGHLTLARCWSAPWTLSETAKLFSGITAQPLNIQSVNPQKLPV